MMGLNGFGDGLRCCCGGGKVCIKDKCSNTSVSGASVQIYDLSDHLLSTITTDGTGCFDYPAGNYKIRATKAGCGSEDATPITITSGGTHTVYIYCTGGRFVITTSRCCSSGGQPGVTVNASFGGSQFASGVSDGTGKVYIPKSKGVGTYTFNRPAQPPCNASSTTNSINLANLCTDTSLNLGASLNSAWVCCAGRHLPKTLYLSDSLGMTTLTHNGSAWVGIGSGHKPENVDDEFRNEVYGRLGRSGTPQCPGEVGECYDTYMSAVRSKRYPHGGTVQAYYRLTCDSFSGNLSLAVNWLSQYGTLFDHDMGSFSYWCRMCPDGEGGYELQHSPGVPPENKPCTDWDVVAVQTPTYVNGQCIWSKGADLNARCGTTWLSGTPTGASFMALASTTQPAAPGNGTVAATFTLEPINPSHEWTIEGSPQQTYPICTNYYAPPPGGISVFVSS